MSSQDNQTQFSQVQPLYEQPVGLPVSPELQQASQKRKKIVLIASAGMMVLLVLTWTISALWPKPDQSSQPRSVVLPTPTPVVDISLRGRIESAQTELRYIGQTEYQLPLPQVDWNIRLEDKKL